MACPKTDGEEENEAFNSRYLMPRELRIRLVECAALLRVFTDRQAEELVGEYDGSYLSAVPKDCLKTIMLWTGFSSFVSTSIPTSIPIDMRGGEKPNWPPVQVVRVVFVFLAMAFYGSLLGLLMKRNFPKLSLYSGYVSLISLVFALGMIAFFTVMWVFERI